MARKKKRKFSISKKQSIFITLLVVTIGLILLIINRTVLKEPKHEIYFHDKEAEIYIGDQVRFGYTISNATNNEKLYWTTSNSNVATVDATGKVRGVSFGDVVITVELPNGNSSSIKLRVKSYLTRLIVNTDSKPIKTWYNKILNVTFETVNIEEIKYCVSNDGECVPNLYYKDKITIKDGIWYLYINYIDRNGKNVTHREIFKVDLVAPKCDIARIGKLYEENATIDVICGEDRSGIDKYEWYRDGKRVFMTDQSLTYVKELYEPGKHKYSVKVYDIAENFVEYKIDN